MSPTCREEEGERERGRRVRRRSKYKVSQNGSWALSSFSHLVGEFEEIVGEQSEVEHVRQISNLSRQLLQNVLVRPKLGKGCAHADPRRQCE